MGADDELLEFSFQWVVGDTRKLEKNLGDLVRSNYHYAITVVTRLVALALVFLVASTLLPGTDFLVLVAIVLAGSLSVWVSWGMTVLAFRAIEKLSAQDPRKVGWNNVTIDRRGIIWSNEVSQEYMSWLGVADVIENDGSLWIMTGPAHGFYLPPRLFSTPKELEKCVKLIEQFRKSPTLPIHAATPSGPDIRLQ